MRIGIINLCEDLKVHRWDCERRPAHGWGHVYRSSSFWHLCGPEVLGPFEYSTILALSMNFIIFNDTKGNRNWLEQNMGSKYRVYSAIRSGQVELKQIWEGCVTIIYSGTKTQDVVYWTTRQYFIPCNDIIYINYLSQDVNVLRYIESIPILTKLQIS